MSTYCGSTTRSSWSPPRLLVTTNFDSPRPTRKRLAATSSVKKFAMLNNSSIRIRPVPRLRIL